MDIAQAEARRDAMVRFVKRIMIPSVDFGKVPGTDKDTLFKPGAEKLSTFFGLSPRFAVVKAQENWGTDGTPPFFYYWYKCELYRGDVRVGEGDGSCNSHESKYRWRWVTEDDLPPGLDPSTLKRRGGTISEFTFAVDKAETSGKYGKPAEYWQTFTDAIAAGTARSVKKTTAKGATYDAWEIDSTVYRIPNDDAASQANTILKMAQKRALVAAVLVTVNASEYFTQDLEDFEPSDIVNGTIVTEPTSEPPPPTAAAPHWIDQADANGKPIRARFWAWTSEQGLNNDEVYIALGVEHIHDYTGTMKEAKRDIQSWIAARSDPLAEDDDIAELWPAELEPVEA